MKMDTLSRAYFIDPSSETRKENDYYPTAPVATAALLGEWPVPAKLLEPCAGRGHISSVLTRWKREVVSRDLFEYPDPLVSIETGVDFLESPRLEGIDGVVTNPPYKRDLARKFLLKSLSDYSFTAFFCRLTFLEGDKRRKIFQNDPPNMTLILGRVNCDEKYFDPPEKQIGGMVPYAWYIWDRRVEETNRIRWLNPADYLHWLT